MTCSSLLTTCFDFEKYCLKLMVLIAVHLRFFFFTNRLKFYLVSTWIWICFIKFRFQIFVFACFTIILVWILLDCFTYACELKLLISFSSNPILCTDFYFTWLVISVVLVVCSCHSYEDAKYFTFFCCVNLSSSYDLIFCF